MRTFALLGEHLAHSHSQALFEARFGGPSTAHCRYLLCEKPSLDGVRQWAFSTSGFNVTLPYKQAIIVHLDDLSPEAEAIGAVNCVTVDAAAHRLTGHNTDAPAFRHTLERQLGLMGLQPTAQRALAMGRGGAARAVAHALHTLGIACRFADRQLRLYSFSDGVFAPETDGAFSPTLLINATPAGMYPHHDTSPWPGTLPSDVRLVADLVYNPSPTLLMRQAMAQGIAAIDGLPMLRRQAELSWRLWGLTP